MLWKNVLPMRQEMKKDNLSMRLFHPVMGKRNLYKDFMMNYSFFRPNCALLTMMKDQFANYVVQKVRFCLENEKILLLKMFEKLISEQEFEQ